MPQGFQLKLLKLSAFLVLLWETVWRSFWPAAVFAGIFLSILLFDLLPNLNWLVHLGVLALSAMVFVFLLVKGFNNVAWPKSWQATRKLETDSNLKHRPLSSLQDLPVGSGTGTGGGDLWRAHKNNLRSTIKAIGLKGPKPGVPAADTNAFRIVPLLLLVIAIPLAWGSSWARIDRGLTPQPPLPAPPVPYVVDAWVSPPTYTGQAPFLVEVASVDKVVEIEVPTRSVLLLQVQGGPINAKTTPSLWQSEQSNDSETSNDAEARNLELIRSVKGAFRFEGPLEQSARLSIYEDAEPEPTTQLLEIQTEVTADLPPEFRHLDDPRMTDAGSLRLALVANDDYGLRDLKLFVDPASEEQTKPLSELSLLYREQDLILPESNARSLDFTDFLDLAGHPLAGQEVALTLSIADYAEQVANTEVKTVTLPVRSFENPLSKQLAKLRQQLFDRPEAKQGVALTLAALTETDSLAEDKFAGVRKALTDLSEQTLAADEVMKQDIVVRQMWDLAKRLDDNPVRRAEEKLRKLEEQLRDALERDAPEAEILTLMDQLREAMQEYQQAVINQKLMEMLESGELNINPNGKKQSNAMEDLASQLEAMTRKGAKDKALDLLDQLKEMMENLANSKLELNLDGEGQGDQNAQSEAMEMMGDLADIMRKQQKMLNDSFRKQQQGMKSNQQRDRENAISQEQLRRQLGDSMRGMSQMFGGEIPDGLGQAERAMNDAVEGLKKGDGQQTLDAQARALNELQRSAKSMADIMSQLAEQQGQSGQGQQGQEGQGQEGQGQQGQGGDQEGQQDGSGENGQGQAGSEQNQSGKGQQGNSQAGTDPLGRSYNPNADPLDLSPEQARRAARDIRDELRRRAGDPNRSTGEQSYIENLLEEF
ncbi:MAG: DUF4175 domain-containing protein [Alphaproteobacteria bacterium]